jgi:hypothetical protein
MNELEGGDHQDNPEGDKEQSPAPIERTNPTVNNAASSNQGGNEEANWPQRTEAVCAVLLVVITGFYTYYAAGQLHKMKRSTDAAEKAANVADQTLKEIRAGSGDTHELAVQAKNQADRTKDLADRALAQANATNELVRQAKRSGDIAATDQRPWVGVSGFQCEGCSTDADGALTVGRLVLVITNTGKTPAVRVLRTQFMYDDLLGHPTPTLDALEDQRSDAKFNAWVEERSSPADRNVQLHTAGPVTEVLAPNAPTIWVLMGSIKQARNMKNGPLEERKVVYFFGKITYSDASQRGQYVTTVCLMSSWTNDANLHFCDTGNDMK